MTVRDSVLHVKLNGKPVLRSEAHRRRFSKIARRHRSPAGMATATRLPRPGRKFSGRIPAQRPRIPTSPSSSAWRRAGGGLHVNVGKPLRADLSSYGGIAFRARGEGIEKAHISLGEQSADLGNDRNDAFFRVGGEWREYRLPFNEEYFTLFDTPLSPGSDGSFDYSRVEYMMFEVYGYEGELDEKQTVHVPLNNEWVEWRFSFSSEAFRGNLYHPLSNGKPDGWVLSNLSFLYPYFIHDVPAVVDIDELFLYDEETKNRVSLGLFALLAEGRADSNIAGLISSIFDFNLRRVKNYELSSGFDATDRNAAFEEAPHLFEILKSNSRRKTSLLCSAAPCSAKPTTRKGRSSTCAPCTFTIVS